jgi:hypothetical protein
MNAWVNKNIDIMKKLKVYFPLLACFTFFLTLTLLKVLHICIVNDLLLSISYLLLAISFTYVLAKEAEIFRLKDKHKVSFRLMYVGGFISFSLLVKSIEYFFIFLK